MFSKLFRRIRSGHVPETVSRVDVARYCGTWYEIASIPVRRQRGCSGTKAEYSLAPGGGSVLVRNSCRRDRREVSVRATAVPVPGSGNAKLIVTFFRFFKGDYWIVGLADDYSWAIVTNPDRSRCWILSRTPYPDAARYAELLETAARQGIDASKLIRTVQG